MAEQQQHYHPVLTELHMDAEPQAAVDVLNYLLETKAVSPDTLRSAHRRCCCTTENNNTAKEDHRPAAAEAVPASSTVTEKVGSKKDGTTNHDTNGSSGCPAAAKSDAAAASASSSGAIAAEPAAVVPPPPVPASTAAVRRRHIALRFYYDGGAYTGLAQNVGVDSDQSVERQLFAALQKAHLVESRAASHYSRCGRTDRGVSAVGQVVALHLKSAFGAQAQVWATNESSDDGAAAQHSYVLRPLSDDELPNNSHDKLTVWVPPKKKKTNKKQANSNSDDHHQQQVVPKDNDLVEKELTEYPYDKILNNLLPPDIRILGWSPVSDDFSARFSATTRTYRYFFVPRPSLHLAPMREALQLLVGTHDFRNLCRMDVEKVYNFERKIHSADIIVEKDVCYILIVGQAFLWHQIRCIAAVLFLIGRGLEEPAVVRELLDVKANQGKPSYPLADERPLVLHDCQYNNLHMGYSVSNLWNVLRLQEQQWEEFTLAAARVRNCMESLQDVTVRTADLIDFCTSKLKQRQKKNKGKNQAAPLDFAGTDYSLSFSSDTVTWNEAQAWLKEQGFILDPDPSTDCVYTPLMQRSKGTTYEEKVASVQSSTKRRQKYEENVIKKRKTKEEDAAFYAHKTKQGGSAK